MQVMIKWFKKIYIQSGLLTVLFAVLYIHYVPKYKAKLSNSRNVIENEKHFYTDLNKDGTSEYIRYHKYRMGNYNRASLHVLDNQFNFIGIWNLNGEFINDRHNFFPVEDYNRDGIKEIFVFCTREDSIFISGIDYRKEGDFFINHKYIDKTGFLNGKLHVNTKTIGKQDINNDGFDEVYFAIDAGYTIFPRRVYALDIKNDTIYKSPPAFARFLGEEFIMHDINNDGKKEILASTQGSDNIKDTNLYPFHDNSAWLMVFAHDLKFLFPPVEFKGAPSKLEVRLIEAKNGETKIVALYNNLNVQNPGKRLFIFDIKGKITLASES